MNDARYQGPSTKTAVRSLVVLLLWLGVASPAPAAVTITFWSHALGDGFPHAFFTLRGTPDAGGDPVDIGYGFTARAITPAILIGPVGGRIDIARPHYIARSNAQFSIVLTDARYADILSLVALWGGSGDVGRYRLNRHNCVHFVMEAARRSGLAAVERTGLMTRPGAYLKAIAAANRMRVTIITRKGRDYLPTLAPLSSAGPVR